MSLEHECEAGCIRYTCGSYKHVKSCKNYPESQSEMMDKLKAENDLWKSRAYRVAKLIYSTSDYVKVINKWDSEDRKEQEK